MGWHWSILASCNSEWRSGENQIPGGTWGKHAPWVVRLLRHERSGLQVCHTSESHGSSITHLKVMGSSTASQKKSHCAFLLNSASQSHDCLWFPRAQCPDAGSHCPFRYYERGSFFFSPPLSWDTVWMTKRHNHSGEQHHNLKSIRQVG